MKLVIDGRHRAGVEPRDVQQRAEDFLDRLQRVVDVLDQARILAAALALDQARHIEPRRIERLQDVVAGGRQESRLRDIGVLGGALGVRQFGIQPGEFLGAVAHALFQRRIGALQRFGGLEARGDVGEGDDEAAARHPVGADLDHHVAVGQALQIGLALGGVGGQPSLQQRVGVAEAGRADGSHEFEDFPQGDADLHQMRRQRENFAELAVRADQLQIGVEHRDALPHMVERGLQDLAVEMQRGMGIVEQLQRGLGGDGALAQQQRHHEARGRRPDRGGDQVFGVLQQLEIGRRGRIEIAGLARGKGLEGLDGALGAEILRHRALDVLHGHRGAPAPEGRRNRRQRVRHEQVRLQPFDRGRLARERQHDIGQDVERERPEHAVHQRRQIGAEQGLRTQRLDAERALLQQQQAGGIAFQEARQEQRVDPHRDADQHAAHRARARLRAARTARRRRPARVGQVLRTTAGRSPPAGCCRARDSRNTPSP